MIIHDDSELTRLPEPVAPATLLKTTMALVSGVDERRPPDSFTAAVSIGGAGRERVRSWKDVAAVAASLAGLAIVVISWIDGRLEAGSWADLVSLQAKAPPLVKMPAGGFASLGIVLGLLLYLGGLFGPSRDRQ